MANIFQIVPSADAVQLGKDGKSEELSVTVTNLGKSAGARALIVPLGDTDEAWLSIDGEEERELLAGTPEEFKILVEVPKEAPEGEHKFRIDVASEENPDDDFSEGPEITIKPAPASKLWLWILLAVLFVVIVVVVAVVVAGGGKDDASAKDGQTSEAAADGEGAPEGGSDEPSDTFMPNLMGLSVGEAEGKATELGLAFEAWSGVGGSELTVSGQTPQPGQPIAPGDPASFEYSAEMPDLVGMDQQEAGEALIEVAIWADKVTYQLSDRYEAGVILEQSIAPQVETTSSETVDVVFSLGSCYWTHQFAQRFGLVSCRSGTAMSGLFCGNKNCGLWQLHCCPYSPGPDPEAELTESDWISPTGQFKARKGAVLDSLECRESGCP
ncbi:MAG: PASTA domain-containing protein, partial [Acidobacteriota bacterium]